ncbi:MAG: Holliday junction branch migration protein RuvA [Candidatus Ancillula sp.]|jgi:Holliday junction DNA helicase RuvA|nr:Holliday junction branch migration protein RuvA [Candidatus Ancillula sp.]
MISFLSGKIISKKNTIILQPEGIGIGYEIFCPGQIIAKNSVNQHLELWISHIVKEESENLYGFETESDKEAFEKLLSVSGVGPKVGLSLITKLGFDGIANAIQNEDITSLSKAPGLGKKGASKIVLELKGKLVTQDTIQKSFSNSNNSLSPFEEQLLQGLLGLGFAKNISETVTLEIIKDYKEKGQQINEKNLPIALKSALERLAR